MDLLRDGPFDTKVRVASKVLPDPALPRCTEVAEDANARAGKHILWVSGEQQVSADSDSKVRKKKPSACQKPSRVLSRPRRTAITLDLPGIKIVEGSLCDALGFVSGQTAIKLELLTLGERQTSTLIADAQVAVTRYCFVDTLAWLYLQHQQMIKSAIASLTFDFAGSHQNWRSEEIDRCLPQSVHACWLRIHAFNFTVRKPYYQSASLGMRESTHGVRQPCRLDACGLPVEPLIFGKFE